MAIIRTLGIQYSPWTELEAVFDCRLLPVHYKIDAFVTMYGKVPIQEIPIQKVPTGKSSHPQSFRGEKVPTF